MSGSSIIQADIVEWTKNYTGPLFHAVLCDPPYNLDSIKKRFGTPNSVPAKSGPFKRIGRGFMGKEWDTDIAFEPETWQNIGNLLHFGAFCMAFSSTRTYHRMATAIEDAGFVIHPMIGWVTLQGFPKATRLKRCECEDEQKSVTQKTWENNNMSSVSEGEVPSDGLAKEEPDSLLFSKLSGQGILSTELGSTQIHDTEGNNASGSRSKGGVELCMEGRSDLLPQARELQVNQIREVSNRVPADGSQGRVCDGAPPVDGAGVGALSGTGGGSPSQEPRPTGQQTRKSRVVSKQQRTQDSRMEICTKCGKPIIRGFEGHRYGLQALKPSFEPICVFQKPYEGRPLDCIASTGAGTLNIDGGRFGEEEVTVNVLEQWSGLGQVQRPDYSSTRSIGRWPANVVIDGDVDLPYSKFFYNAKANRTERDAGLDSLPDTMFGQSGGAQGRLAEGEEEYLQDSIGLNRIKRVKNPHPTVKPLDLCRWLAALLLPPEEYDGRLLVPFSGSGSEVIGALQAGWNSVTGVEIEEESCNIANLRIKHWIKEN